MITSFGTPYDPHRMNIETGVTVFALLSVLVSLGNMAALVVVSVIAWLLMFPVLYWMTQSDEGRPAREFMNLFEQSWSLYGCALCLLPAYLAAASQWVLRPAELPAWAWQWWWTPLAAVAGVVISRLFKVAEKTRYDPRSRDEPAKRYFDDVLFTLFTALLLARVLPVLFAPWHASTVVAAGLVLAWFVLMAVDGLRYLAGLPDWAPVWAERAFQKCRLIPEKQHPRYDKHEGRLLK